MKVKELIKLLTQANPEARVNINALETDFDIGSVGDDDDIFDLFAVTLD